MILRSGHKVVFDFGNNPCFFLNDDDDEAVPFYDDARVSNLGEREGFC